MVENGSRYQIAAMVLQNFQKKLGSKNRKNSKNGPEKNFQKSKNKIWQEESKIGQENVLANILS